MAITIPDYFHRSDNNSSQMKLDDVTFIELNYIEEELTYEVCLQSNLFVFILQGEKIIKDLGQEYHIKAGNGLFLRNNHYIMSHVLASKTNTYQSFILFVGDDYLNKFVSRHGEMFELGRKTKLVNFLTFKLTPLIKASIDSVFPYFQHSHNYKKAILQMKLDELLINLLQTDKSWIIWNNIKNIAATQSTDLKTFMELNYTQPWSIETFALKSGRSLSKFKLDFKAIFSNAPKKWINKKRLNRAKHLITNSNYAITEISHLAGYDNLSYFIQLFKKTFHITPKQLQKN